MSAGIDIDDLQKAIAEKLSDFGDLVFKVTDEALGVGEALLIERLKASSPRNSGEYAKLWKGTGKTYKMQRFIGNAKTVPSKKNGNIPLSNILEYSTTHGNPHIKETFNSSVGEIAAAIVNEIKKGI